MKNKIPSTEEFLEDLATSSDFGYESFYEFATTNTSYSENLDFIYKALIEFTKLHVAEALKHASEYATITNDYGSGGELFDCIDKESILNAYDLNNIK